MICNKCGTENNSEDSKFCKNCGNPLNAIAFDAKKNASFDVYLDENDNKFLDMLNIPRKDDMFVKSCKLCVIRRAMQNQISEYKKALSKSWLTDDEWLGMARKEKMRENTRKFASGLTAVIGAVFGGIVAVFKTLIALISNIFSILSSLLGIIIYLIIFVIILAVADNFLHFSQYITPVVNAFNTVKSFISKHYIIGLVIIGGILIVVSVKILIDKNTERKQAQNKKLLEYQRRRDEGLKKQEEAKKNLQTAELMYGYTTKILTKMNESRESIPPEYWDHADSLWYLYQSRRANTVQEAINLFEEMKYKSRIEEKMNKSLEMASENRRAIEDIKKISSDARDFSENAMLYAQQSTSAAYSAASAARSAEWEAMSAKWEAQQR